MRNAKKIGVKILTIIEIVYSISYNNFVKNYHKT